MEDGNEMRSRLLLDTIYVIRRYIRFSISAIKWLKSSSTRRERILTGGELTFRTLEVLSLHLEQFRIYGHDHCARAHEDCTGSRAEEYAVAVEDSGRQGNSKSVVPCSPQ